jgi:hypothetical protein
MYRCGICGCGSIPGQRAERVVTEIREKVYPKREGVNRTAYVNGVEQTRSADDPGGKGWEIVKEVLAHPACAQDAKEKQ